MTTAAFFTPVAVLGGAERALVDLVTSLVREAPSLRVHVLVGEDGPLVEVLRDAGADDVQVLALPDALRTMGEATLGLRSGALAALGLADYARRLRRAVREVAPAVLHTNGMKAHLLGAMAAVRRAPVVWHVRDLVGVRRRTAALLRGAAPFARGAIAVSRLVADDLRGCRVGLPIEVVHDAVDVERFAPLDEPPSVLDALAGLSIAPPGTVRVGLLATYSVWKGHDVFLEAAARVDRAVPVRFYVVGGPIYDTPGSQLSLETLRARAAALGIAERVAFVGFQREPAPIYRDLDVVVHASTAPEPFGLTIAEALACGRAVIATRTAGCVELLRDDDALTVPPRDPAALARAIDALARDPARRRALGRSARDRATAQLDRRRLGGQLLAAWRTLGVQGV